MILRTNRNPRTAASLAVLASILFFSACTPVKNTSFISHFLPPAPKNPTLAPSDEPPKIEPNVFLAQTPAYFQRDLDLPPRPTAADMRIRRADERYSKGRVLFQNGDLDGARREFDAAVEILLATPAHLSDRLKVEKRLEEMVTAIYRYDVNSLGAVDTASQPSFDKAPLEDILDLTFPVDPRLKPRVNQQLKATASQLPLEVNDAVLSYINFFTSERGKKTLLFGLRRAGRYKPLIQRILAEEGVPQELIFLAQAESGFLPRAVSYMSAVGMWQFVKFRGNEYGLMQSAYHDDRLDPEKATRAAARHLRDLYDHFGDWYLAMAAYNCGPGGVDRAIQRTGYADFWELRSRGAIPRETSNYIPIILAMTIITKNAKEYGIGEIDADPPLNYDNIELPAATHLALVADLLEQPVTELRDLNPALLGNTAPAGYQLHIPKGTAQTLTAGLEAVPAAKRSSWRVHRCTAGDTVPSIAKRYGVTPAALTAANESKEVAPGELLLVPAAFQETRTAKSARPAARTATSWKRGSAKGAATASARRPAAAARKTTAKPSTVKRPATAGQRASLR